MSSILKINLIQVSLDWSRCIKEEIRLPIPNVHTFTQNGEFSKKISFDWEEPGLFNEENVEIEEFVEEDEVSSSSADKSFETKSNDTKTRSLPSQIKCAKKSHNFSSSTALMISQVIGTTNDLVFFDRHDALFRKTKSENSRKICDKLMKKLQLSVVKAVEQSKERLAKWEKDFFLKTDSIPLVEDNEKGEAKPLFHKINCGKKLMKKWKL